MFILSLVIVFRSSNSSTTEKKHISLNEDDFHIYLDQFTQYFMDNMFKSKPVYPNDIGLLYIESALKNFCVC